MAVIGIPIDIIAIVFGGLSTGLAVRLLGGSFLGGLVAGIAADFASGFITGFAIFPYSQFILPVVVRLALVSLVGKISILRAIVASFVAGIIGIVITLVGILSFFTFVL